MNIQTENEKFMEKIRAAVEKGEISISISKDHYDAIQQQKEENKKE